MIVLRFDMQEEDNILRNIYVKHNVFTLWLTC